MKSPIRHSDSTRTLGRRATAAALGLTISGLWPALAGADDWVFPHSQAEAIKMEEANALPLTQFYDPPSLAGTKPGALLRHEPFDAYKLPAGATAVRILYHSLSFSGADVAASGVVLLPSRKAPAGGWPVIVWAHGTTGVARTCAPSLQKDVAYGEEGLFPMVRAGFAVIAPDYRGLGTPGPHEWLYKMAQARDVLYSVPAARAAVPSLSRPYVVIGHSQGGMAAWGAAELGTTLKDPDFRGAIAVAAGADLKPLLEQLVSGPNAYYADYAAYAVHAQDPKFKAADMLMGHALASYGDVTTKGCYNYIYGTFVNQHGAVVKAGWESTTSVRRYFDAAVFGTAPLGVPLLVLAGEGDTTVVLSQVKASVARACASTLPIAFKAYPGLEHDPVMDKSTPDQLAWARDRLAGKPFKSNCSDLKL